MGSLFYCALLVLNDDDDEDEDDDEDDEDDDEDDEDDDDDDDDDECLCNGTLAHSASAASDDLCSWLSSPRRPGTICSRVSSWFTAASRTSLSSVSLEFCSIASLSDCSIIA